MQFVTNGPDIPDELLQAHEEGKVVFFCGAGISYPAGLLDFKGLVQLIYKEALTKFDSAEQKAFDNYQYDATLDLLERRLPNGRSAVREALARALKPNLRLKGATDTHAALLNLGKSRTGALRLVTTNFDRVFDAAARRTKQRFNSYSAPMLPLPKVSRWDGVVYLHGLLPTKPNVYELNRLVITSGDFGLAYLTERWAARFVSELFRNYVVCFVGYSVSDPVLRYMMDALAADRMLGENTPQAWAFGSCKPGEESQKTAEWKAKGVVPILYHTQPGANSHRGLHQTLKAWSETYRDGTTGKERIVTTHALSKPSASTWQDDFVGRMLWALSDRSGLPARRFADFSPAPSLEWLLGAFSDPRYCHSDLGRFGIPAHAEADPKLNFSLVQRPTPYHLAAPMALVGGRTGYWDDVMFQIARWLVRHLDDPDLLLWLTARGGSVHERLAFLIQDQLGQIAKLESQGKTAELNAIRKNSPKAVPGPLMRKLWGLFLAERIKSPWRELDLYSWTERLKRDGLTASLRLQLRVLLSPVVSVSKPFRLTDEVEVSPTYLRHLVNWELVLSSDHVRSTLSESSHEEWTSALPLLLDDFQVLLRDALDLLQELGSADSFEDRSFWDLPSVSRHWQNRGFREWVVLIELLRDSWLASFEANSEAAVKIARDWFEIPYPTFKRLALFAASQEGAIPPDEWVKWLLIENGRWLWAISTKREVYRLLVLQGQRLSPAAQEILEARILLGPPRESFVEDITDERYQQRLGQAIWRALAKLQLGGLILGDQAQQQFDELSMEYPYLRLAENESDEFSHWMSGTGDPDYHDQRVIRQAPYKRAALVEWLRNPPADNEYFDEDTWRDVCKKHLLNSLYALGDLAREGQWLTRRWQEALRVWSEPGVARKSWRHVVSWIETMPDEVLSEVIYDVTRWLDEVSKSGFEGLAVFLRVCRRVMGLSLEADTGMTSNGEPINQPVTEAINHPIGHITQALLNIWQKSDLSDDDRLPEEIGQLFTELCDSQVERYRHGRVLLASRLIALFRVDEAWTRTNLLPHFSWAISPVEARRAWEGFLWSPRLYSPLLLAFKADFLETASHYEDLGEHAEQFAAIFTYAALGPLEGYSSEEFRLAFATFPLKALQESAQSLSQALEGAGEQRVEYWQNRILPFWKHIWPKSQDLVTPTIAESLIRMSIAAGSEFPAALDTVYDWLVPTEHMHYAIHELRQSGLCTTFPVEALRLLAAVVADQAWLSPDLRPCLEAIAEAQASLAENPEYRRLADYMRRRGQP
ncbi:hypothetical protein BK653_09750 [Pseudomonas brassicacearum]|uniref:anti-phage defense-associated sirtuin Dsr1 n=1 Tax=Pseudomonas brassicacearum TaxID=930166 RepID=UPI000F46453F|nr:anti-phage defense-associated sirtuin Dsr1 [Pseudomonas brassicacearum]ROM72141.1 hypothetical protein BK653_09750 [Pseudomonas brassicacearum]